MTGSSRTRMSQAVRVFSSTSSTYSLLRTLPCVASLKSRTKYQDIF